MLGELPHKTLGFLRVTQAIHTNLLESPNFWSVSMYKPRHLKLFKEWLAKNDGGK